MVKITAHTVFTLISRAIRPKTNAAETRHIDTTLRCPPPEYQEFSKLAQLPEEVLLIIADHLGLADRGRLLQTCRYFHSLLEVIQYRHLDVSDTWLLDWTHRLHRTLSERPDLIPYIISYRGPLTPVILPFPSKKKSDKIKSLLRKGTTAPSLENNLTTEPFRRPMFIFPKAINIRELEFTDGVDWTSNPIWEPVKTAISIMSLTRLSLRIASGSAEVVPQLQAQPGLEHLELWTEARLSDLKETDIPKLKSLSATLHNAATIVPGRPVEEFHLGLGQRAHWLDEQLMQKLSLSSGPITKLVTRLCCPGDHDVVRHTLQVLARHLPQLRHLTLDVAGLISGRLLLDEIPAFRFLCSVKFLNADLQHQRHLGHGAGPDASGALAGLDNGGDDGTVVQIPAVDDWEDLLQRLREKCPLLVAIEYKPLPPCRCASCVVRALG